MRIAACILYLCLYFFRSWNIHKISIVNISPISSLPSLKLQEIEFYFNVFVITNIALLGLTLLDLINISNIAYYLLFWVIFRLFYGVHNPTFLINFVQNIAAKTQVNLLKIKHHDMNSKNIYYHNGSLIRALIFTAKTGVPLLIPSWCLYIPFLLDIVLCFPIITDPSKHPLVNSFSIISKEVINPEKLPVKSKIYSVIHTDNTMRLQRI